MIIFKAIGLLVAAIIVSLMLVPAYAKGLIVRISPNYAKVNRDSFAIFRCFVTGDPATIVTWHNSEGRKLTSRAAVGKIPGGYMLRYGTLHPRIHNGTISCKASNGVDTSVTDTATLHVLWKKFDPLDPSLPAGFPKTGGTNNHKLDVVVGKSITLTVNVTGNPPPKITWFRDNQVIDWANPRFTLLADNNLHIANSKETDSGWYDYMAENDKGRIFSKRWAVVPYIPETKPVFTGKLKDITVNPETNVVLNCSADGYPKPTVDWEYSKINQIIQDGGLLRIINILYTATYKCIATNGVGSSSMFVMVMVRDIPLAPINVVAKSKTGYSITISWQEGNTSKNIHSHFIKYRKKGNMYWQTIENIGGQLTNWTINNLDLPYTDYEVQVFSSNNFGISKGSAIVTLRTAETAPGTPPHNIIVKATGSSRFMISWDPPLHPNGIITEYYVFYTHHPERELRHWDSDIALKSPHTILGLSSNYRYAVMIKARTAAGAGPFSKKFLVQTLKGAPSDPQNVEAKVVSSTSVKVTWSKPIFDGGGQGVIGYVVHYNHSSSDLNRDVKIQSPYDYSRVITGLSPYTTYKVAVAAKSDAGSGPLSFAKMVATVEDVPSTSPANLSCVKVDHTSVRCSWNPPAIHSRNGKITSYTIRYKTRLERVRKKDISQSTVSLILNGLQAYTEYLIDIAASTSVGKGPYSKQVSVTTEETKPTKAPRNVTAIAISSTSIYVSWKAPIPPFGAKLLGYVVLFRQYPEEQNMKKVTVRGNKLETRLVGLLPEKKYEVLVAVHSSKGNGKFTHRLYVRTKQPPPPPPILIPTKIPGPNLRVAIRWISKARNIEEFKLRYTKEVEKIKNVTVQRKLVYVEKTFSKTVTSYNLTNLEYGLWYLIKLSVLNPGGWSTERQAWVEMNASTPTGAPLKFTVEHTFSTSIQLSWDLPSKWKRRGKIIGYKLTYQPTGSLEKEKGQELDSKTKIHLRGLRAFTDYKFTVRAKTVAGEGPVAEIHERTKEDVPSDFPTVEIKAKGTDVVLVMFKPPSTPNGNIVGYKTNIYLSDPIYGAGVWRTEETDGNVKEMYIGKLLKGRANYRYWFKMAAKTSVGYGPYSPIVSAITLDTDCALPVRKLSADSASSYQIKISWESPPSTTGVRSFQINYSGKKRYRGRDNKLKTFNIEKTEIVRCCNRTSITFRDLQPYTFYNATVSSLGTSNKTSEPRWINFTTKAGSSPPFPKPNISNSDITGDYIPIYLSRASEKNGLISHYLVYVASLGVKLAEARAKLQKITKSSVDNSRSRREIKDKDSDESLYITAKLPADNLPAVFKAGEGQDVNGYTNKPLTRGHFYAFAVESCVLDERLDCLVTNTGFTDLVEFSEQLNARTSSANNDDDISSKLWLVGPAAGILLVIIFIVVLCLLWKRRVRSRNEHSKRLSKLVREEQLPMMTSPKDPVEMQRLNLETEGMKDHPPIHISQLGYHIEDLRARSNSLFTREYESIDPGLTFISEASARHLNQSKNRYPNIVPYDHTRIILQETNGFLDSDYINASFMAGYKKQNAYIATQAPLLNTITDFWQMIWEQDTRTIVMMTNLQEKGRIKCDQYWPNNNLPEKFGIVSVTVLETVELAHYTIRTFRLCKDGSNSPKEIKQFQYTAWPDHGVPHYSTSLLCFIRKVRLSNPADAGPMVVHCSAGVGRTGVFIVIDSMLERIRKEQTVDIYGHVTVLRSQRNHMIQTEEQYIFIHETLLEAVLFRSTEIQASDLSQYYKKLNEIGETETTNMENQFKQLSNIIHPRRFVTAILPVNRQKNRFPKILPYEHSRADLVPVRGNEGSNYINASFIDGYKQRRAYIAAQGPLEDTVNDFWRMIMEKKCNIIVMLTESNGIELEMSAEYWPAEKSAKYHFYIVDPISVEETPNFTLRQFKVNDMMSSCPNLIKLFQLRKWPERGKPQSSKAILDLIGQVHTARNNDESKGPVVVHCGSGSGRTGVFCALSIVVERMRAEGVVDILQTVRQLREQRPEMVETHEQYAFCYETALQYLSSFDHIA